MTVPSPSDPKQRERCVPSRTGSSALLRSALLGSRVLAALAGIAAVLAALTSCRRPEFCSTAHVSFILPTVDDSLAFDTLLCARGKKGRQPSFEIFTELDHSIVEVAFTDPNRPGEPEGIVESHFVTPAHCTEGLRIELSRSDTLPERVDGVVIVELFAPEPGVCTINFRDPEVAR